MGGVTVLHGAIMLSWNAQNTEVLVDIFMKRLPATTKDLENASNSPGLPSTNLKYIVVLLHSQLEGEVNLYTRDHRGRSTRFDYVAAQLTTYPITTDIKLPDVPACAKALQQQYGDLASFSTTSAPTDVVTFISKYTNGECTIVYSGSYGTTLTERVMHLAPPEVIGHGIATLFPHHLL
ncbi:Serine protease [Phytophthora megakarya]|uniref:Serine protease n=1 Tax=Phytophthora megakarya TaxID=4795 RepID=A0A225VC77_9STRA|nr:Serine protease [Phytophthora megakarya]